MFSSEDVNNNYQPLVAEELDRNVDRKIAIEIKRNLVCGRIAILSVVVNASSKHKSLPRRLFRKQGTSNAVFFANVICNHPCGS